jgi:hypothetical protein
VGFYAFSQDEEERAKQMQELRDIRSQVRKSTATTAIAVVAAGKNGQVKTRYSLQYIDTNSHYMIGVDCY